MTSTNRNKCVILKHVIWETSDAQKIYLRMTFEKYLICKTIETFV